KGERRDRAVVGPGAAAGDVPGGHARLVLADVGEQRGAGAVADRPDALRCLEALVRLDSALRDLHAELLEAETFGVWLAAGRDQQLLCAQLVAVRELEAYGSDSLAPVTPDVAHVGPEQDPDPFLLEGRSQQLGRVAIDARHQPVAALH